MKIDENIKSALRAWLDDSGYSMRSAAKKIEINNSAFSRYLREDGVGMRESQWLKLKPYLDPYLVDDDAPAKMDPRLKDCWRLLKRLLDLKDPRYAIAQAETDLKKTFDLFSMMENDKEVFTVANPKDIAKRDFFISESRIEVKK